MPPRRRDQRNEKLPPYVYLAKGRYILRRYDPTTRRQTETRLCAGTATLAEVWRCYEATQRPLDHGTWRWLSRLYLASPQAAALADSTRRDYQGAHRRICAMELADGRLLGDLPLADWSRPLVQRWQDRRGTAAPVTANREKSYMARVFAWGLARGHCADNPAQGVPRIRERARTRYVTDGEYLARLEHAAASSTPYLVPAMELAYLLRARLSEVLDLQRGRDLIPEGIHLHRRKGSRDSVVAWSPRLRAAVDAALALHGQILSLYVLPGTDRGRLKESSVQTAWQRLSWPAAAERFTLHDLKAKGITDTAGDKLAASGHRDPRMLAIYDRLPGRVTSTR